MLLKAVEYSNYYNAPCWSRDGRTIVVPSADGVTNVYTGDGLRLLKTLRRHDAPVYFADISADNKLVASASADSTVRIWNLATGKEIVALESFSNYPVCVKFSPTRELAGIIGGGSGGAVALRSWERVASIPMENAFGIGGLSFHPSLPLLAVKDNKSRRIYCYNIDYALLNRTSMRPDSRRYANAESGAAVMRAWGSRVSGLVLSGAGVQRTDSTHGRRVWTFDTQEVEVPNSGRQTREDVWEIRPGRRWQQELRRVIRSVRTVAVFIGPSGARPWQELEVESLLGEFARRRKPIIPVILEGRQGSPRLPAFLNAWHKVDMRRPEPRPVRATGLGHHGRERSDVAVGR